MAQRNPQAGGFLVAYDPRNTHARRVRLVVNVSSLVMVLLGSCWAIFFGLAHDRILLSVDLLLVLGGVAIGLLARQGNLRFASLLLAGLVYVLLFLLSALFDIPSADVPRSLHTYFLLIAVGSYLLFRRESAWVRHGYTLACFAAFVYFASSSAPLVSGYALPDSIRRGGTWVNNICAFAILYLIVHAFIGDVNRIESYLHEANNRFVDLVRGMFPKPIAERLLTSGRSFAERHQNCSVLFSDIVSFTRLSEQMDPDRLVDMLSAIFSRFDALVEARGLTKIKTIGDAYMVAAGVPEPRSDHAQVLLELGREMLAACKEFEGIELRIGISSGDLVAGVIGNSRQVYDVWGDAVNMASRMESHGIAGQIQVSGSTYQLVGDQYAFSRREGISIKGKVGRHDVFVLA